MGASDFVSGQITERKAIGRLIAFQAARAGYRSVKTPVWRPLTYMRLRWTLACLTQLLEVIEQGDQHKEPSQWLGDWPGEKLDRAIAEAVDAYDTPTTKPRSAE